MTCKIIPKKEAIDRMRDGLPCETLPTLHPELWRPTRWSDFDISASTFRISPEPRREAREWWLNAYEPHSTALTVFDSQKEADRAALKLRSEVIHVREVLPDEVVLRRMTEAEGRKWVESIFTDPKNRQTALEAIRALGLIAEGKS